MVALVSLLVGVIELGGIAPDFTAKDTDGKVVVLSKLVESGPVILAFFHKAFTGG